MTKSYEELRARVIQDVTCARNNIIKGNEILGLSILTGLTDSLETEISMEKELADDNQSITNSEK